MWGAAKLAALLLALHPHHHHKPVRVVPVDIAHVEENAVEVKIIKKEKQEEETEDEIVKEEGPSEQETVELSEEPPSDEFGNELPLGE